MAARHNTWNTSLIIDIHTCITWAYMATKFDTNMAIVAFFTTSGFPEQWAMKSK